MHSYSLASLNACCLYFVENKENERKKTSTLGRFFKSVTLRRSGRKYTYKPPDGEWSGEIIMDGWLGNIVIMA